MTYKKNTIQEVPMPPLGAMLKAYFKQNRTRKGSLAKVMGKSSNSVMRYQRQNNFSCSILWELSLGLNHNFFADLAAQLPQDFTTKAPDPTLPLQERLAELEEQNKLLNAKLETLMAVLRKG
ncbi:hypothetical protein Aeqsu_2319 [Aequorivita sublithincola DSM 14238]|uniref:HTH cro/C1-type domain-containing protein n=1 Tax=Aequorivita sublithincola (strain DSM 14238 / LMG 21431 / ACAM 643 / 9-3) TaxID=746697 RepID=I3YXR1_AEQSU|nr:hypothetical protein [Aequorivita sublithincola]AFL81779.1 hypothetical protein Aeqsu_2319 [Aequorivita sublithincola DSM 14238]